MKRLLATAALAYALILTGVGMASAQEPYLGEVRLFGYNWCPNGWTQANGAILPINQFTALFSLYGTNFGGNGSTTFGVPNLTGRAPTSFGSTPPGQPFASLYGSSSVTLTVGQLPAHTHQAFGSTAANSTNVPTGAILPTFPAGQHIYAPAGSPANAPMAGTAIGSTGNNQPVQTQSPSLALNWCVAIVGIYPSRP
jgi:microcystin-dependent protein